MPVKAVPGEPIPISDLAAVRDILIAAARAEQPLTYAGLLGKMCHGFSRPKMRVLCHVLGDIDAAGEEAGEPELAVLVVRASDGLPGHGWWVSRHLPLGYQGPWAGEQAEAFIKAQQKKTFDYWKAR